MDRWILHLDIDAFLASIEQLREPSLRGRPVVVGSGCVASRSYEAKARGVQTAMGMAEAKRLCPDLVVRDGDAAVADRYRQRVAEVLRGFVPLVQVCSLDDMYGDLGGVDLGGEVGDYAARIRAAVREATGLSVSQGLGSSKVVARMATRHAKPAGVRVVEPADALAFVGDHPLRELPGVGHRTLEQLAQWNLASVRDLWAIDRAWLERAFGARGAQIWWRARGLDGEPGSAAGAVVPTPPVQSISRETSFPAVSVEPAGRAFLLGLLSYLLDRAATELRAQALRARTVQVRIGHVDGVWQEKSRSLREATARHDLLLAPARALFETMVARRVLVRLVGVALTALERAPLRQGELFAQAGARRGELFAALDRARGRHGFGKLVLGPAIELLGRLPNSATGFRLKTPSLSK